MNIRTFISSTGYLLYWSTFLQRETIICQFRTIYSVEAQPRANERVKKGMEQLLRNTVVGYDTVNTESSSMHLETGKIRYAMMPVWLLSTRYRGKVYKFAMNAQTGKFVGELPISWRKFWGIFALITGIVTAVGTVLQIFM